MVALPPFKFVRPFGIAFKYPNKEQIQPGMEEIIELIIELIKRIIEALLDLFT
jgi:hypothetical protein